MLLLAVPLGPAYAQGGGSGGGILDQLIQFLTTVAGQIRSLPEVFNRLAQPPGEPPFGGSGEAALAPVVRTNNPPRIAPLKNRVSIPHVPVSFQVVADDLDGDPVRYSADDLPLGATFEPTAGLFRWTPRDRDVDTSYVIIVRATDGRAITSKRIRITVVGPSEEGTALAEEEIIGTGDVVEDVLPEEEVTGPTYTLAAPDQPIKLRPIGNQTINVRESFKVFLSTVPSRRGTLYTVSPLPSGAQINQTSGVFQWAPERTGDVRLTFTATNGQYSDTKTVTVSVPNHPPALPLIGRQTALSGKLFSLDVGGFDPDGDPLTYSLVSASGSPSGMSLGQRTGMFSWRQPLTGGYRITYKVDDGLLSSTGTFDLTVKEDATAVNLPPSFTEVNDITVQPLQEVRFTVSARDPEQGLVLIFLEESTRPDRATFQDNTFSWTPSVSHVGKRYPVTFTASDTENITQMTVTITVIPQAKNPPRWVAGLEPPLAKAVNEGGSVSFDVKAESALQPLTYTASGLPAGASFGVSPNDPTVRRFSWAPGYTDGQPAPYSITFSVSNADGSVLGTTAITVSNVNQRPTITTGPATGGYSVQEGGQLSFLIQAADADPEDQGALRCSLSSTPSLTGAGYNCSTGVFTWVPDVGWAGSYPGVTFTFTDTGGLSISAQTSITVTPQPFSFSLSNSGSVSAVQGSAAPPVTITTTLTSGSAQPVSFSAAGLPAGATPSFSPANCSPSCSTSLTITTAASTPVGTYPITVKGSGGGIDQFTALSLTVTTLPPSFSFSLSNSGSVSAVQGSAAPPVTITTTLTSGSAQPVSFSAAGLPAGALASFSAATCTPSCTRTLSISTSGATPVGSHAVTVAATGGEVTRTTTFNLTVTATPFDFSLSNGGARSVVQGSTVSNTITISSIAGAPEVVSFSADAEVLISFNEPNGFGWKLLGVLAPRAAAAVPGMTFSFSPTACTPTCSTTLSVATNGSVPTGNYAVTVTGTAPSRSRTTVFTLTVTAPLNFTLANGGNRTVQKGSSTANTITATLSSGASQSVSFSASGFPSGVSGSFSPTACTPTCSATLTMTAQSSAAAGSYPITVTGTAGSLSRTTSFTLSVTNPPTPAGSLIQIIQESLRGILGRITNLFSR